MNDKDWNKQMGIETEKTGAGGEFLCRITSYCEFTPTDGENDAVYEPEKEIEPGEEFLGTVASPEIKALYKNMNRGLKLIAELMIIARFGQTQAARDNASSQAHRKAAENHALADLLWIAVRLEVGSFDGSIGLRKDWKIVKGPSSPPSLTDLLGRIIGRGGEE